MSEEVRAHYSDKWKVGHLQRMELIKDFCFKYERARPRIDSDMFFEAAARLRRKRKLDSTGLCALVLIALEKWVPGSVTEVLTSLLASTEEMASLHFSGNVLAKKAGAVPAAKTRVIMPLPVAAALADAILETVLETYVEQIFPAVDGFWEGARKGTQSLEITAGLQLVIEKGLDEESRSAIAAADIKAFYDSYSVLAIIRFLADKGFPGAWGAALLRLHCLPRMVLCVARTHEVTLQGRTIGAMTGSRSARAMGRVPVLATVADRIHVWRQWAYTCRIGSAHHTFVLCSYVDNLYATAHERASACAILDDCEAHLTANWGLVMGSDSRSTMAARGARDDPPSPARWPSVSSMNVLGRVVSDSASPRPCLDRTFLLMWQAFYANVAKLRGRTLCYQSQLLQRSVQLLLRYRCPGWTFTPGIAKAIRSLQTAMNARCCALSPLPHETRSDFCKRRNLHASRMSAGQGRWDEMYRTSVLTWDAHLDRQLQGGHGDISWPAVLRLHLDESFFNARREVHGRSSRTRTRIIKEKVQQRYHDGIKCAQLFTCAR